MTDFSSQSCTLSIFLSLTVWLLTLSVAVAASMVVVVVVVVVVPLSGSVHPETVVAAWMPVVTSVLTRRSHMLLSLR